MHKVAAVLMLLCLPTLAHAQLRFGVAAEVNRTSFGGVPPKEASYAGNYGAGFSAIVEYRVHRDVVLSVQPGWLQRGAKIVFNEDEEPDSVQTFVVEQSWVTVPVYFRIDSDGRGMYAGGGLSLDFLLDSELEHDGATVDNSSVFDDIDITYQFTVGYLHELKRMTGFVELRYLQGLVVIGNTNQSLAGDLYVSDFKSNGLRLVAGMLF